MKKYKIALLGLMMAAIYVLSSCSVNDDVSVTGIALNKSTLTLQKGAVETLILTVQPSNATAPNVVWTSSNPSVASVTGNGVIVANSVGTAVIIVSTHDDRFSATCQVSVQDDTVEEVPVTGIVLDKSALTLQKGETETLIATVLPSNATNPSVAWTSSNPSVASVTENGVVTANSAGTAVVIATTRDGQFTATCQVDVQVNIESITLSSNSLSLERGESVIISASISPDDATDKTLRWSSEDPEIASVDNTGQVTALKNGVTVITVTNATGSIKAVCQVSVTTSVASISLDVSELTLVCGQTRELKASILPEDASNKNVTWTSSNENVATVSSVGQVVGVSPGKVSIIVTTEDKSKTASCIVNVVSPTDVDYNPYGDENKW